MPTLNRGESSVGGEGGQGEDEAAEDDGEEKEESKGGKRSQCERTMEMTARNLYADYKQDNKNYDGLLNSNGGDMTEIRVPLSQPGKRITPIEGDNLYRLRDRKFLLEDKKRLCAWALGTAILGILLMILHAELCPVIYRPVITLRTRQQHAGVSKRNILLEKPFFKWQVMMEMGSLRLFFHTLLFFLGGMPKTSIYAFIINGLISLSTGCLLILIVAFHIKDIRLFTIDHNQVDWRIAMTTQRVLGISLELVVCAIHPVATYWLSSVDASMKAIDENGGSHQGTSSNFSSRLCSSAQHKGALLDSEVLLSSLMFLRLYLVHRAILLHSKVLLSASYRSIGSLNNINFTFRFVLKVLMNKYPGRTLLFFILFFWLTASWLLTLCERQIQAPTGSMDTALWLIAITFLTVGYGDVSPQTTCGKMVCLFAGVMGVACTAMLVAVMTKKLALNKGEKHVHYFMMDIQISKRIRHAAANVLRECWLLHRADSRRKASGERRQQQRHLLEAIRVFRYLRLKQRKLRDNANEMVDLPKMQMIMCDLSANWNNSYRELEQRIISMERKLDELGRSFHRPSECQSDTDNR